jgi:hypothetical protein
MTPTSLPEIAKAMLTPLTLARLASEDAQRAARLQNTWRAT